MINVKDIYDKANSVTGISQNEFITSFNEAVLQLLSRYGESFVFDKALPRDVTGVDETVPIYDEWRAPILHYVIYLKNGDALRKNEYDSSLDYSYRTLWKKKMNGRTHFRVSKWH